MALKPTRNWHNEDSDFLKQLKPDLLRHLGPEGGCAGLGMGRIPREPERVCLRASDALRA